MEDGGKSENLDVGDGWTEAAVPEDSGTWGLNDIFYGRGGSEEREFLKHRRKISRMNARRSVGSQRE